MNRFANHMLLGALACSAIGISACGAPAGGDPAGASGEKLQITEAAPDQGMKGVFTAGGRQLSFETRHVATAGANGTPEVSIYARIFDPSGDTLAGHVFKEWPASRPMSGLSKADIGERIEEGRLVPGLGTALKSATISPAVAADRDTLLGLTEAFTRIDGAPPSAPAASGGIAPQTLETWVGSSNGFQFEIYRKPAFVSFSPFEHSAMQVRNWSYDWNAGAWYTASVWVQSGNMGARADDPAMSYKCTSNFVSGQWWEGADSAECPGTAFPIVYGRAGVCNNSTIAEKLQMQGWTAGDAIERACYQTSIQLYAPDCL